MSGPGRDLLYGHLPQFVRDADLHQPSQPLRTLYRVLQSAYDDLEADVRALYDDWFIETCAEDAVPRIAALVGADLGGVPALPSHRALVANTLRWRGRPGTLATLAQAAASASGWPAAALDLGAELAMSAAVALSPAPGPPAVARIPPRGTAGPGRRPPRSASVSPAPPGRGRQGGSAYLVPGAVSLSVFTLPVFLAEDVEPGRRGGVLTFRPDGLTGPLHVAPEGFAPAAADPGLDGLPRPLTRDLLRDLLAAPTPRLPFAIRRRRGRGWVAVRPEAIGVARLDPEAPLEARMEVLVDPERGLFAVPGGAPEPPTADLRVDYGFGFGGPVGAAAWSPEGDAPPPPRGRRIRVSAHGGARDLDEALEGWDGASDLDITVADGGRIPAPRAVPRLKDGVALSISAAPGARPSIEGELSVEGERAELILRGLSLPRGVVARGVSLALRGCTVGMATGRALRVACGWDLGRLRIEDSLVGPVVAEVAWLTARTSVFDGRPATDAAPGWAIRGIDGPTPAAAHLDRCTVLGDLDLARAATLSDCAVEGAVREAGGTRRLRAAFVTLRLGDPYYLQLAQADRDRAGHGAFGGGRRAGRMDALDAAVARHLPQGLACSVVLAS